MGYSMKITKFEETINLFVEHSIPGDDEGWIVRLDLNSLQLHQS